MQTNAAVADPTMVKNEKRNETSVSDRIRSYLVSPGSGVLALLPTISNYVCCADLPGSIYSGQGYSISDTKFIQFGTYTIRECLSDAFSDQHLYYDSFVACNRKHHLESLQPSICRICKKGNKLVQIIRITAETLSGIPSIVYGLFGMLFFVTALHWDFLFWQVHVHLLSWFFL